VIRDYIADEGVESAVTDQPLLFSRAHFDDRPKSVV